MSARVPADHTAPLRIGLLATYDGPLLGYVINALSERRDSHRRRHLRRKDAIQAERVRYLERTEGRLPRIPLEAFESHGIPFFFSSDHRAPATVDLVTQLGLELLVNAGTPRILRTALLRAPRIGVLNCHPGLLPGFRGCTCVEWAIFLDEAIGNTVHFMNEGIDSGPIVLQEALDFAECTSYADIRVKVQTHGVQLLADAVRTIARDDLHPSGMPLPAEGRYFPVIDPARMDIVLSKISRREYAYQRMTVR